MNDPVIQVDGLTKRFGDVCAVNGISFSVARGQTVALLGGNGAGKTTTISMLLGLLLPTGGRIEILGADIVRRRYRVLPRMNFSSPYVDLPHRLTVRQNLNVYAALYRVRRRAEVIERLAAELDITRFLERQASSRPARKPGSPWLRLCSMTRKCCCWMSRPPRWIPTRPTACALI